MLNLILFYIFCPVRVLIAIHWNQLLKQEENCQLWFLFLWGKVLASIKGQFEFSILQKLNLILSYDFVRSGQSFDCNSLKTIVKGGRKLSALIYICSGQVFASIKGQFEFSILQKVNLILSYDFFDSGQSFDCHSLKTIVKGGRKLSALIYICSGLSFSIKNMTMSFLLWK